MYVYCELVGVHRCVKLRLKYVCIHVCMWAYCMYVCKHSVCIYVCQRCVCMYVCEHSVCMCVCIYYNEWLYVYAYDCMTIYACVTYLHTIIMYNEAAITFSLGVTNLAYENTTNDKEHQI